MDTWNRPTAVRGEVAGGLEEISRRTYMHMRMARGHRRYCGEGQVGGGWVEEGKQRWEGWGTSVIVSTIKINILLNFKKGRY